MQHPVFSIGHLTVSQNSQSGTTGTTSIGGIRISYIAYVINAYFDYNEVKKWILHKKCKANFASECDKKDELGKMYRYIFISYKYIIG